MILSKIENNNIELLDKIIEFLPLLLNNLLIYLYKIK